MATAEIPPSCCSNPACDQPGTSKCSACKTSFYCGPICQTAHWAHHKEECEGHLLKIGSGHFAKAKFFYTANNKAQALRYSDLALGKFNAMKIRPLEAISDALSIKCASLNHLGRDVESLQCAKDKYNLWALARGPAHPSTIHAAFYLINALLLNNEYEDAEFYARSLWEIIHTNNHVDNDIPGDKWQQYVAIAAELLARAIHRWAEMGGIPPEEKQKAGEEATARAREALEIHTQLQGTESGRVATAMCVLANVLDYFSDSRDDEILRLYQQSITVHTRINGRTTLNVASNERSLGNVYHRRATKARAANDLDGEQANLELALPHYREAARIFQAINDEDSASGALSYVLDVEEKLRQARVARAAALTS